MRLGIVRMGMAVCVAGCFLQAVCQTPPSAAPPAQDPSDFEMYYTFFGKVTVRNRPTVIDGQPIAAATPSIQEAAGLTDREMKVLDGIAADCYASLAASARASGPTVFDALMEDIATGKDTSTEVEQSAKDQEAKRERVVLDHVQQLRTALGAVRFQELTAWLRADEASRPKRKR